jgi:hypothetical protein
MAKAKGNPFWPDLHITDVFHRKAPLCVELKLPPLRWRPGQRALVERGIWKLVKTFEEFRTALLDWETTSR